MLWVWKWALLCGLSGSDLAGIELVLGDGGIVIGLSFPHLCLLLLFCLDLPFVPSPKKSLSQLQPPSAEHDLCQPAQKSLAVTVPQHCASALVCPGTMSLGPGSHLSVIFLTPSARGFLTIWAEAEFPPTAP